MMFDTLSYHRFRFSVLAVVAVILLSRWLGKRRNKPGLRSLPGPRGLPWVGPVWDVDGSRIYLTFRKWAEVHGPIYQVTLFGKTMVVISEHQIARDLLAKKASICSDRPSLALVERSRDSGLYLPFLGNNGQWHQQRKFGTMINMVAAQAQYHGCLVPEAKRLLAQLLQEVDEYDILLDRFAARVSTQLAWGTPAPAAAVSKNAHNFMQNLSPGGRKANILNVLKLLPDYLSAEKRDEKKRRQNEYRTWAGMFEHVKTQFENNTLPPCYASAYFQKQDSHGLNEWDGIHAVAMMSTVSILTLTAPLGWFIVAMALHPEWQEAAQKEIDSVCGDRMAELSDSAALPTVRAVILESMRWLSPVPTGIPHVLEEDTDYNGYLIRKGTNMMACDWSMCRNPSQYQEPDSFKPDRYLNPDYPTFREPLTEYPKVQGHTAFGFGRRVCIGQDLAASELLVACAAMLWAFTLKPKLDQQGNAIPVEVACSTPDVIPMPSPQMIKFEARSEKRAQQIMVNVEGLE